MAGPRPQQETLVFAAWTRQQRLYRMSCLGSRMSTQEQASIRSSLPRMRGSDLDHLSGSPSHGYGLSTYLFSRRGTKVGSRRASGVNKLYAPQVSFHSTDLPGTQAIRRCPDLSVVDYRVECKIKYDQRTTSIESCSTGKLRPIIVA